MYVYYLAHLATVSLSTVLDVRTPEINASLLILLKDIIENENVDNR